MIISSFGLHTASGVPFLVQGGEAQNLISPDLRSPFQLHITPKRARCPHQINLSSYVDPPEWVHDPLAAAFLPTPAEPGEKVKLIFDPDQLIEGLLVHLQRLSSPTGALVRPIWGRVPKELRYAYQLTNITPLVFIGACLADTRTVTEHMNYAATYQRRVVVFARERIPLFAKQVDLVETDLTPAIGRDPLEAIGSGALRRIMDAG